MSPAAINPTTENQASVTSGIFARFGQVALGLLLQGVLLFLAAGRLDWLWGWSVIALYLLSVLVNSSFMLRASPETVAERGRPKAMRSWDKTISGLWSAAQFLLLPLIAGLDIRFGWTGEFSLSGHVAGALLLSAGLGLFGWAMIVNAYFSTVVRIQTDRGQTVCRRGPYRTVRHPGYVGTILQSLGIPLLLGSVWDFLPASAAIACMIVRTSLEDRTLRAELPGYQEYANEVPYRLFPGIY